MKSKFSFSRVDWHNLLVTDIIYEDSGGLQYLTDTYQLIKKLIFILCSIIPGLQAASQGFLILASHTLPYYLTLQSHGPRNHWQIQEGESYHVRRPYAASNPVRFFFNTTYEHNQDIVVKTTYQSENDCHNPPPFQLPDPTMLEIMLII